MKRIAIIGTVGVPACYGGFESLVENMLDYTPEEVEYTVFCTSQISLPTRVFCMSMVFLWESMKRT